MPKIIIEATTEEITAMLRALLEPKPMTASPNTTIPGTGISPAAGYPFYPATSSPNTGVAGGFTMGSSVTAVSSSTAKMTPQNITPLADKNVYHVEGALTPALVSDLVHRFETHPTPPRHDKRPASKEEAKAILTYNELSDKQRKLIKILYLADKPLSIDAVAKKMKAQRNSALATKGNLVKRASLALGMEHPPIFINTPDGKNSMEITEDFRKALDELPVNIATDW